MMTLDIENGYRSRGYTAICGIDEAGRGPLCGPVCAAAVILPEGCEIEGLNDSKKLSEKKREALFDVVCETAVAYGIGTASAQEIDEINILQATFLAMRRAVEALSVKPDLALIDGNRKPGLSCDEVTIVKGDAKCMSIAAASILAKVTRDRYMREMDKQYPQYCFAQHKGYGTKLHYEKIAEFGICDLHRRTFLKKILGEEKTPPTPAAAAGKRGEDIAAAYYEKHGFSVTERNFHARCGEIDVIAENADTLVFCEVKTRKPESFGRPCEAVDSKKQAKIVQTALLYLQDRATDKQPRFDVVEVFLVPNETPKVRCIPAAFDSSCLDGAETD